MSARYILFPAIYIGGELQKNAVDIKVDCSKVTIEGEHRKQAWDPVYYVMRQMFGFFIEFDGIEYGTLKMTQQDFIDTCNGLCCGGGGGDDDRIHVNEFAIQFV